MTVESKYGIQINQQPELKNKTSPTQQTSQPIVLGLACLLGGPITLPVVAVYSIKYLNKKLILTPTQILILTPTLILTLMLMQILTLTPTLMGIAILSHSTIPTGMREVCPLFGLAHLNK